MSRGSSPGLALWAATCWCGFERIAARCRHPRALQPCPAARARLCATQPPAHTRRARARRPRATQAAGRAPRGRRCSTHTHKHRVWKDAGSARPRLLVERAPLATATRARSQRAAGRAPRGRRGRRGGPPPRPRPPARCQSSCRSSRSRPRRRRWRPPHARCCRRRPATPSPRPPPRCAAAAPPRGPPRGAPSRA